MSKSLGNVIRIRDAVKQFTPAQLRYYFESFHYREPVTLSERRMKLAANAAKRMQDNFRRFTEAPTGTGRARSLISFIEKSEAEFKKAMDDDFDTPRALRSLAALGQLLSTFGGGKRKLDPDVKRIAEQRFRAMADVLGLV